MEGPRHYSIAESLQLALVAVGGIQRHKYDLVMSSKVPPASGQQDAEGRDSAASTPAHRDFLYRAYSEFQGIIRFADAKAAGVLVLLGLGLTDLISKAPALAAAHGKTDKLAGCVSTVTFWLALPIAVAIVASITHALFPRMNAKDSSLFFFGDIQQRSSSKEYIAEVDALSETELGHEVGKQVWQLSRIACTKMHWLRWSYYLTLFFLGLWAAGRLALYVAER